MNEDKCSSMNRFYFFFFFMTKCLWITKIIIISWEFSGNFLCTKALSENKSLDSLFLKNYLCCSVTVIYAYFFHKWYKILLYYYPRNHFINHFIIGITKIVYSSFVTYKDYATFLHWCMLGYHCSPTLASIGTLYIRNELLFLLKIVLINDAQHGNFYVIITLAN